MQNIEMPGAPGGGVNVREQVSIPAILLMVVGGLTLAGALLGVVQNLTGSNEAQMEQLLSNPDLPEGAKAFLGSMGKLGIFSSIVQLALGALTFFGGLKMKNLESHSLAMAAAIVAVIPCFGSCCCTGIPVGIWALVVLNKPEVKAAFRPS